MKELFKNNWKNILLVLFFFIIIVLLMSTTCTNHKLGVAENNIKALNDSVKTYQLKNGELMYEKQGFILEKKQLEEYLDISKNEIKELEKKLGSALATIAKLKGQIRIDTLHTVDSIYVTPDSIYYNNFKYNDRWLSLNGTSKFTFDPFNVNTNINSIIMDVPLKIGTSKDNQWFVTSENPYVNFSSIEGANIEKAKPKRWSITLQFGVGVLVGYGLCIPPGGGVVNSGIIVGGGLYGGIGGSYKLLEF